MNDVLQFIQFLCQPVPCLYGSRGCVGCCEKSLSIIAADGARGMRIQGGKPYLSDDFWSTSTCDLDTTLQSQRSFSSISVPNQSLIQSSGTGGTSNHSEFINPGVLLWNQNRAEWCGAKKPKSHGKIKEPVLSWNATYDNLLSTSKRFPQMVPLSEMVDFLVDTWDQEGLYD